MDLFIIPLLISLIALVVGFVSSVSKQDVSYPVADLDDLAVFIYELDDPDTLKELSILTDVRRLLLHLELTEGRVRLG